MTRPVPKSPEVSERMKRQKTKGTKPELALAAELRRRRFTVLENVDWLPGRPDLVLPNRRTAIFVHGCFWHGCPRHGTTPKHNRRWWAEKIARNKRRDRRKAAQLRRLGWSVYSVWEHSCPVKSADRIRTARAKAANR